MVDADASTSRVLLVGSGPDIVSGTGSVVCIGQTISNLVTFVGYGRDGSSSVGDLSLTNGAFRASLLLVGRSIDGANVEGTASIAHSDVNLRMLGVGEVVDHLNEFTVGNTTGMLTVAGPSNVVSGLDTNGFEINVGTASGTATTDVGSRGTLELQAREIDRLSIVNSGLALTALTNTHAFAAGLIRLTCPTIRIREAAELPFWYIGLASAQGDNSSAVAQGSLEVTSDLLEPLDALYCGVTWASNFNARSSAYGNAMLDVKTATFQTLDLGVHYGSDLSSSSDSLASGVLTVTERSVVTIEKDLRAGLVLPQGQPSTGRAVANLHVAGVLKVNGLLHLGEGSTSRVVIASNDVPRIQAANAEVAGGVLQVEFALPGGPEPGVLYPAISINSSNGMVGGFSSVEILGGPSTMAAGIGRNDEGGTIIWAGTPPSPEITGINVSETGVVLQVSGVASGTSYQVEQASNLSSNSWFVLDAPIPSGDPDTWIYLPTVLPTGAVYRSLYRTFD